MSAYWPGTLMVVLAAMICRPPEPPIDVLTLAISADSVASSVVWLASVASSAVRDAWMAATVDAAAVAEASAAAAVEAAVVAVV